MDKFINAFSRSQQQRKDDQGRSHQFVKRLAFTTTSPLIMIDKTPGQTLSQSELSPIEKVIYSAWWNELDPFGLGVVVDEAIHPFLQASGLVQETLQQIIDCYAGESRYTEDQFYAILRLVAHGQSGRKINRDLVALGAPLANFDQEALDSLSHQGNNNNNNDGIHSITTRTTDKDFIRNTWWGQPLSLQKDTPGTTLFLPSSGQHEKQQRCDISTTTSHRHSYGGSTFSRSWLPTHSDTEDIGQPSSSQTTSSAAKPFDWAEQALLSSSSSTTQVNDQKLPFKPLQPVVAPSTITAITTTNSRNIYSHSRSRSVPHASQDISSPANGFLINPITATQSKQDHHPRPVLLSSRSSMDTTDFYRLQQQQPSIDHGQSLLLTQKFIPPISTTKSTNPFEDNSDGDDDDDDNGGGKVEGDTMATADHTITLTRQHQQGTTTISKSPFDDDTTADNEKKNEELPLSTAKSAIVFPVTTTDDAAPSSASTISSSSNSLIPSSQLRVTPTLTYLGNNNFTFASSSSSDRTTTSSTNQQPNQNNITGPTIPPQSTKPVFRNQPPPLKRSQSQHDNQKHSFMSQGAFLLATSSASSSVKFPTIPLTTTTMPYDDTTNRLFRHRSTTSFPHQK